MDICLLYNLKLITELNLNKNPHRLELEQVSQPDVFLMWRDELKVKKFKTNTCLNSGKSNYNSVRLYCRLCQAVLKFSFELNVNSRRLKCSQWQWCFNRFQILHVHHPSLADGSVQLRLMGTSILILKQPLVVDLSVWTDLQADITTEPRCSPDQESETFLHGMQIKYPKFVDMVEVQSYLYFLTIHYCLSPTVIWKYVLELPHITFHPVNYYSNIQQ